MSKILVTGSNGFIGSSLVKQLAESGISGKCGVHNASNKKNSIGWTEVITGNIDANTDWTSTLESINVIIHLAARSHIMKDSASNPLSEYKKINTYGTLNLARQAAKAKIHRFIYISSIKVNGEETEENKPLTEKDMTELFDPYAISKLEAEQGLVEIATQTGMEIVIIRPPLIYGPGVMANFLSMMKLINSNIPLPFGRIKNKRSLIGLNNLIDLIKTCISHPAAANQIFLVSDGNDLSTTDLFKSVASALGKKPRLFSVNQKLLNFVLSLVGMKDIAVRLCGSLQLDISKVKNILNWSPPMTVDEGLKITATDYINKQQ